MSGVTSTAAGRGRFFVSILLLCIATVLLLSQKSDEKVKSITGQQKEEKQSPSSFHDTTSDEIRSVSSSSSSLVPPPLSINLLPPAGETKESKNRKASTRSGGGAVSASEKKKDGGSENISSSRSPDFVKKDKKLLVLELEEGAINDDKIVQRKMKIKNKAQQQHFLGYRYFQLPSYVEAFANAKHLPFDAGLWLLGKPKRHKKAGGKNPQRDEDEDDKIFNNKEEKTDYDEFNIHLGELLSSKKFSPDLIDAMHGYRNVLRKISHGCYPERICVEYDVQFGLVNQLLLHHTMFVVSMLIGATHVSLGWGNTRSSFASSFTSVQYSKISHWEFWNKKKVKDAYQKLGMEVLSGDENCKTFFSLSKNESRKKGTDNDNDSTSAAVFFDDQTLLPWASLPNLHEKEFAKGIPAAQLSAFFFWNLTRKIETDKNLPGKMDSDSSAAGCFAKNEKGRKMETDEQTRKKENVEKKKKSSAVVIVTPGNYATPFSFFAYMQRVKRRRDHPKGLISQQETSTQNNKNNKFFESSSSTSLPSSLPDNKTTKRGGRFVEDYLSTHPETEKYFLSQRQIFNYARGWLKRGTKKYKKWTERIQEIDDVLQHNFIKLEFPNNLYRFAHEIWEVNSFEKEWMLILNADSSPIPREMRQQIFQKMKKQQKQEEGTNSSTEFEEDQKKKDKTSSSFPQEEKLPFGVFHYRGEPDNLFLHDYTLLKDHFIESTQKLFPGVVAANDDQEGTMVTTSNHSSSALKKQKVKKKFTPNYWYVACGLFSTSHWESRLQKLAKERLQDKPSALSAIAGAKLIQKLSNTFFLTNEALLSALGKTFQLWTPEKRAAFDFWLAIRAKAFVGFGKSSFSTTIATYRHNNIHSSRAATENNTASFFSSKTDPEILSSPSSSASHVKNVHNSNNNAAAILSYMFDDIGHPHYTFKSFNDEAFCFLNSPSCPRDFFNFSLILR